MVRGGGAAAWAVVEDGEVRQLPGQLQHVGKAVGDELGHVAGLGHGEVAREDGEGIYQQFVVAQEGDAFLFGGSVGGAEEAAAFLDGPGVDLGAGGDDAGGVELHLVGHAAHVQFLDAHAREGVVAAARRFPGGELAVQQMMYVFVQSCHSFCSFIIS